MNDGSCRVGFQGMAGRWVERVKRLWNEAELQDGARGDTMAGSHSTLKDQRNTQEKEHGATGHPVYWPMGGSPD
jgi:hypothetical protein